MNRRERLQGYLRDKRVLEQTVGHVRNALRREATRVEEGDYLNPVVWQAWRTRVMDALLAFGEQAFALGMRTATRLVEATQLTDDAPAIPPEWEQWYRATVGEALRRYAERERQRIADIVREGALQGTPVHTITRAIQQAFVAMRTWQAERIARTEVMRFYNLGHLQVYARQPLLVGYEYSVILDDRTSHICQQIAGKRVRAHELRFLPPLHPHCRTVLVPLFQSDGVEAWDDPQTIADAVPAHFGNIERLPLPTPVPVRSVRPQRAATAPPSEPAEPTFPATLEELTEVRPLGGTTGARLMRDARGNLWIWKEGADAEHAMLEHAAHTIYRAFGVDAPASRLYKRADGTVVLLSEYIEGQPFSDLAGELRARAAARLREGFLIDALLGNYDALGLEEDNVIVDARGRVWRVDNGASFWRRARGGHKPYEPADWDALWTLRGLPDAEGRAYRTPYTALMRELGLDAMRRQFRQYDARWGEVERALHTLPPELQQQLSSRLRARWESLRETMRFADNMREAFKEGYSDRVVFWYQKFQQFVGEAERQMFHNERLRWKEQTRLLLERCRHNLQTHGVSATMEWVENYSLGLARQARLPAEAMLRWQGALWRRYGAVMDDARKMISAHGGSTMERLAIRLSHLVQAVREGVPDTRFFQHEPLDSPLTDQEFESVAALHAFTQVQLRAILQSETLWIWRILVPDELASRTSLGDLSTNAVYPRLFSLFPERLNRLFHARVPLSQVLSFWGTLHWESAQQDLYGLPHEFEFTVAGAVDFAPFAGETAHEKVEAWLNQLSLETQRLFGD